MIALVRLAHECAKRRALLEVARKIAHEDDAAPIGDEFLDELAERARAQVEEVRVEPLDRKRDARSIMLECFADQIDRVGFRVVGRTRSRGGEDSLAVELEGHREEVSAPCGFEPAPMRKLSVRRLIATSRRPESTAPASQRERRRCVHRPFERNPPTAPGVPAVVTTN